MMDDELPMLTRSSVRERRALLRDVTYRVDFELAAGEDTAGSRTEVRFGCRRPGESSFIDLAVSGPIKAVLNDVELSEPCYGNGRLVLPRLEDENVLVVEAPVAYSDDRLGLCSFSDGDARFAYTKGGPSWVPRFMCCFMGAGSAAYELRARAPVDWSVVSHTAPTVSPAYNGDRDWHFGSQLLLSPHVLTFAAGPWSTTAPGRSRRSAGSGARLYGRPSVSDALASSPISELLTQVLDLYEDLLGIAYPFGKADCVLVPGYGSQASAMPGLFLLHERVLRASLDPDGRRYVLWVIAHEAAHAWFGHVVDAHSPDDLWLTEGVATYLCHRAMYELAPTLHPWVTFHILEEAEAHDVDVSADSHAIAEVPSHTAIRGGVPALAYAKPAAALRHLEAVIGRRAVDAGFAKLLTDHPYELVATDDMVRSWEASSGVNLDSWANDWLRTKGVNVLELELTAAADGTVETCQVRQETATPDRPLRTHHITIQAYDETTTGLVAREPIGMTVAGPTATVPELVGDRTPDLVVLNAPATSYAKVRLDERSRQTLAAHLRNLEPETRAVCWIAGREMVKDGLLPAREFHAWVAAHGHAEPDPQVRQLLLHNGPPGG
jgi:aminopeptidase N